MKTNRKKNKKVCTRHSRGFVLLFASLIASLLTALGLAMYSIAQKELVLSSLGRESQYAFYAADTGAECATYWDFRKDAFSTATTTKNATCNGQLLKEFPTPYEIGFPDLNKTGLGGVPITTFWYEPNGYCVYVTVTKRTSAPFTQIESLGYNTPCNDPSNSRRLERAVRVTF